MSQEILAVIPARGGSKSIQKKNLRLLNGKPLIFYSLRNALRSKIITDIVVTSDDEDILYYASKFPVCLRQRPPTLAADDITLDPVVYDATEFMENKLNKKYSIVVTLQTTSPVLNSETLDNILRVFIKDERVDTIVPVVDATHLFWHEIENKIIPDYDKRLNRQWLPKRYKETGAFLITRRRFVDENTRFGNSVSTYILNEVEGLDIDSPIDWLIAEALVKRLRIAFVANGNKTIGTGHIYRTIALANRLIGHNLFFITYDSDNRTNELIVNAGFQLKKVTSNSLVKEILNIQPDLIVNDILDTTKTYVTRLKKAGLFVVNFEDLGEGAEETHLTFNALYEKTEPSHSYRFGYRYECINDLFLLHSPITFKAQAETLLLTFGGIDQNNLTCKVLETIPELLRKTTIKNVISIIGSGYMNMGILNETIRKLDLNIEIYKNVNNMPEMMSRADIAITSNGRTVYELAVMGVPTLSIAQNDRETLHSYARYHKGVIYLGIANTFDKHKLLKALSDLCANSKLRKSMYQSQIKDGAEIRKGISNVINEIFFEYWRYKDERDTYR